MIADIAAAERNLAAHLSAIGEPVRSAALRRLDGGAGPESWALTLERRDGGCERLVLRTDAATRLEESRSRSVEFAALRAAYDAGVPSPRPVRMERDPSIVGAPFFLMTQESGTADPHTVLDEARPDLLTACAAALARIHAARLDGASAVQRNTVSQALRSARRRLRDLAPERPALAYLFNWCSWNAPEQGPVVFAHRDFRVGNLLTRDGRLVSVLDWEFAGPSEREADLGWFCAPAWRHGRLHREAGGLADLADWLAAYESASGVSVDPARVRWWMVMGQLRWALVALEQVRRARTAQPDLDLALTGHRLPSIERDGLDCVRPGGADDAARINRLFTQDGPTADTLLAIAERAPRSNAVHLGDLHAIAARLGLGPTRDANRARDLMQRAARPEALEDVALWSTLRAEARARAIISRRPSERERR